MADFFAMGGYGSFIWPAYGAVGAVLIVLWITSRRFVSSTEAELAALDPKRSGESDET